jgi:hypothetical protein
MDCGTSAAAHAHVQTCRHSKAPGEHFGSAEQFRQSNQERAQTEVVRRLRGTAVEVRQRAVQLLARDLEHLGITLPADMRLQV